MEVEATYSVPKLNVPIPPLTPGDQPDVVAHDHLGQDHLHAVHGEEAARAGVPPVPEREIPGRVADEVRASRVVAVPAPLARPEGIEALRVGDDARVPAQAVGRDLGDHAGGNDLSVGEREGLEDLALEGGWGAGPAGG